MRISWLLFKKSVRQNWKRLLLTSIAIMIGSAILFNFTAVFNALLNPSQVNYSELISKTLITNKSDFAKDVEPFYVSGRSEKINEDSFGVLRIYINPTKSRKLGKFELPKQGEYYLSPKLKQIVDAKPYLAERYGNKFLGVLDSSFVSSPDKLFAITSMTEKQAKENESNPIYALNNTHYNKIEKTIIYILYSGIFILLFPVMIFISTSTQLGSRQREQRYSALRLIGATKKQITQIITFESSIATVFGIILGALASLISIPILAKNFTMSGRHLWPQEVTVRPLQIVVIVTTILIFTILTNWISMRKVRTTPLGVARDQKVKGPARWWRILPMLLGVTTLFFVADYAKKHPENGEAGLFFIGSLVLTMFGIVIAGSWITKIISSLFSKITNNATILLATKYISAHSREIFRSVSGITVALFAGTFFLVSVSGIDEYEAKNFTTTFSQFKDSSILLTYSKDAENKVESQLIKESIIKSYDKIHIAAGSIAIVPCEIAPKYLDTPCESSKFIGIKPFTIDKQATTYAGNTEVEIIEKIATDPNLHADPDSARNLQPAYLLTIDRADIDKLRTLVIKAERNENLDSINIHSKSSLSTSNPIILELAQLTYFGIAFTLALAIISLVVSTIGGMLERQRSLTTLRLGGMESKRMKRMVLIESLIPLFGTAFMSIGMGILFSVKFIKIFPTSLTIQLSAAYLIIIASALTLATISIYSLLPMIRKITSLENNRTE